MKTVICRQWCPVAPLLNGKERFSRKWSNLTNWPNKTLPKAGDDVTILSEWIMQLDIDPPALNNLFIDGDLVFMNGRNESNLSANNIWIRQGRLIAGDENTSFTSKINIILLGD